MRASENVSKQTYIKTAERNDRKEGKKHIDSINKLLSAEHKKYTHHSKLRERVEEEKIEKYTRERDGERERDINDMSEA